MNRPMLLLLTAACLVQASEAQVEARLRQDVTFLASPALKGRGNGSPELDRAAARIVQELRALGLKPQVQRFPFVAKVARTRQAATLTQGPATRTLVWGKEIEALGLSGDADFKDKPLAFLGYGLQIPGGYDDLAGVTLKDRVAVIARSVPELDAFAHLPRGERSLLARLQKLQAAQAAGVIVLETDGLRPLRRDEGPVRIDLPVVGVTEAGLGALAPEYLDRFKTIRETGKPDSDAGLGPLLSLTLDLRREEVQLPNIVTVIPGRDPKLRKEYIALGAHLDHLGLGERHSLGGEPALG